MGEMLKIVHIGKYYLPDTGGIESTSASLAMGAVNAGHEVSVVCFIKSKFGSTEVIDGVQIFRAPFGKNFASQPISWRYMILCLREARQSDIVHLHFPNMLGALCSLFISQKPRLLVHWHSDVIGKGLLGWILRPLETALLKRADRIVTTSKVYAEASPTLRTFLSKVSVVPSAVPDPIRIGGAVDFSGLPMDLETKLHGKKLILSIGRLVPYKGFGVLIEAARHLIDDAVVVIVGGGPLQESLQLTITTAGVTDRVHLAGRQSAEVLHALLNRASLFCLPSIKRSEAFGLVITEAMAFGIPIVATDIPGSGVPWVNQHGVSGINVPVGDPVAIANACNRILNSPEESSRFSIGARQRFLSEFTEELSVKRMLDVYIKMSGES